MNILLSSIDAYVPSNIEVYFNLSDQYFSMIHMGRDIHQYEHKAKNFGDAYNFIVKKAFEEHEHIIVCNDDAVFTPTTYDELSEDYESLLQMRGKERLGWVGCLTNWAIGAQNIRRNIQLDTNQPAETLNNIRNYRELQIIETNFIAPICAAIGRYSWIDYLPINYYSDNLQCIQMTEQGRQHFISTAYVHHAGSQTVGTSQSEHEKSMNYLRENYPEYFKLLKR